MSATHSASSVTELAIVRSACEVIAFRPRLAPTGRRCPYRRVESA
jgi:hypothetical protein